MSMNTSNTLQFKYIRILEALRFLHFEVDGFHRATYYFYIEDGIKTLRSLSTLRSYLIFIIFFNKKKIILTQCCTEANLSLRIFSHGSICTKAIYDNDNRPSEMSMKPGIHGQGERMYCKVRVAAYKGT